MMIPLFDLVGARMHRVLHGLTALRSREALRTLRGGVRDVARIEVAVWALLQSVAVWLAIATAMLLSGCAAFDGSHTNGKLRTPESYAIADTLAAAKVNTDPVAAQWPTDTWWKQFDDPQLDALIDEALRDGGVGPLRQAEARLRSAQALVQGSQSRTFPSLGFNGVSQRERFSENYIYPPPLGGSTQTINQATLNFGYELDFWGRNRAAIAANRSQAQASAADAQAARLAVTTAIARAWFQLQRFASLREVTLAAIKQRDDVLTLARQRFDAGLDTNAELRQAEALLPVARVDLAQVDEAMALVRNQIAQLLGKGPDRAREIGSPRGTGTTAIALPANLPAELIGRRPDLVAARWRVEASASQIDNAKAQFYPSINLVAAAGFLSLGASEFLKSSSRDLSGGLAVTLPIFEGGALRANLAGRNAEYDGAVEQYNAVLVDAVRDVSDQIVSLQSVDTQLADQHLAREKAEQAYDVALVRYKAGLSTYLTVLTAETLVLQQRRADAELRARVLDLDVSLMRALGGGYHGDRDPAAPLAAR